MRIRRLLASGLAALAAFAAAPPSGEAAEGDDLNPPMVGVHEIRDQKGVLSFRVPARTVDKGLDPSHRHPLAAFGLIFHNQKPNDIPEATLWVDHVPGFARAGLAHRILGGGLPGVTEEPLRRVGDGVWDEVRNAEKDGRKYLFRWVERDGFLFTLGFEAPPANFVKFRSHFERIASSMKLLQPPPRVEVGTGLVSATVDGRELRTDRKDRKGAKKVLQSHLEGWKGAAALLGPKLAWQGLPVVVIVDSPENVKAVVGAFDEPFLSQDTRAVVCSTKQALDGRLNGDVVMRLGVNHYVRAMHGGQAPDFIESGLSHWAYVGVRLGGKPDKIPGSELKKLRAAVAERETTMPGLWKVNIREVPEEDFDATVCDLWGWHLFFRHAPEAGEWAALYQRSLDALRDHGDVDAAEKVWDGVDGAALRKAYVAWVMKWTP